MSVSRNVTVPVGSAFLVIGPPPERVATIGTILPSVDDYKLRVTGARSDMIDRKDEIDTEVR